MAGANIDSRLAGIAESFGPETAAFAAEVTTDDAVSIAGRKTRWELGGPLAEGTTTVAAPAGIVDYVPNEMIATVRAGTLVADLNQELANAGQRSALVDRGGTVGGAIAVGEDDPLVLGVGRIRASVLQVRYVSAEGDVITGGGPTVKNVTGFDLPRLFVGSLGTLGSIVEVIVRTNPIPAVSRWLISDDVDPFAVRDAVLRPSAVFWNGSKTWVLLEGHQVDVEAEAFKLDQIGSFSDADGAPTFPPHRWSFAPADLKALPTQDLGPYVASVGVGTVFADNQQPRRTIDAGSQTIAARLKAEFDPKGRLNPGRNPNNR